MTRLGTLSLIAAIAGVGIWLNLELADASSITNSGSSGGGSTTFDAIGSGTNTTATMTVGTGGSIVASGSGSITATTNANLTGDVTSTGNATTVAKIAGVTVGTPSGTGNVLMSASPTTTGTFTAAAITGSGILTNSQAGAASASAVTFTGAPYTGGTGTSTYPLFYINGGTAPTTWATTGTAVGINLPNSSTANFIDCHVNGGGTLFNISSGGAISMSGNITANRGIFNGGSAASQSGLSTTIAPYAAGTGTTTFPLWFANGASATAKTSWSTSGTVHGDNIHTSVGNFEDYAIDGTSQWILTGTGKVATYGGIATAGIGVPAIYGYGRSTAQTAAVASVATFTVGAADASFDVGANVNVTTSTTHSFTVVCTYTDEASNADTVTFSFVQSGAPTPIQTITNVTGVGAYCAMNMRIRAKASTAITIATSATTFTAIVYNVEGSIIKID